MDTGHNGVSITSLGRLDACFGSCTGENKVSKRVAATDPPMTTGLDTNREETDHIHNGKGRYHSNIVRGAVVAAPDNISRVLGVIVLLWEKGSARREYERAAYEKKNVKNTCP